MKKKKLILAAAAAAAVLAAALCVVLLAGPRVYEPAGEATGVESLDDQVLTLLQTVCKPRAGTAENLGAVYDWVLAEISYRPGAADTAGGFTDALTFELAEEMLNKRRGNCDGEAALLAVLLRRMGCTPEIVQGTFRREDGVDVDHAWVVAQVDGTWYHFDTLYERTHAEDGPRSCFMQSDDAFAATHDWNRADCPACG